MAYYTALDVSLRSVSICIVDQEGDIKFEAVTSSEVADIERCVRGFSEEIASIGFEAGTLTQYLCYGLQEAGYEVICLEARQVSAALAAMRNKTDKNDARGIAQVLRYRSPYRFSRYTSTLVSLHNASPTHPAVTSKSIGRSRV